MMIECFICDKKFEGYQRLSTHIRTHKLTKHQYYDKYLKSKDEGVCPTCGNPCKFASISEGYRYHCSISCAKNDPLVHKKYENTCLKKYGVISHNKAESTQIQKRRTCLKKYGVENISQISEVKKKKEKTCLKHFGVKNPRQSDIVKDKSKQTCINKYGVISYSKTKECKIKYKKTSMERFDADNFFQTLLFKQKCKETCLERYGVDSTNKLNSVKKKQKETCLKLYGVDNYSKTDEGRRSSRITAIKYAEKQILEDEPAMPRIGNKERPFLNDLQKHTEYKILRQDPRFRYVIGRFPDGHIPELKLCILFDEPWHFEDKECTILNEDSLCETRDYKKLDGYRLIRVSEKEWLDNQELIIDQFQKLTMGI